MIKSDYNVSAAEGMGHNSCKWIYEPGSKAERDNVNNQQPASDQNVNTGFKRRVLLIFGQGMFPRVMMIRGFTKLSIALLALATLVLVAFLFLFSSQMRREERDRVYLETVSRNTMELILMTDDYLLFRDDRGDQQWDTLFSAISRAGHDQDVQSGELTTALMSLKSQHERFKALYSPHDMSSASPSLTGQKNRAEQHLMVQLRQSIRHILALANKLTDRTQSRIAAIRRENRRMILAYTAGIFVLLAIHARMLFRRVLRPANDLNKILHLMEEGCDDEVLSLTAQYPRSRYSDEMALLLKSLHDIIERSMSHVRELQEKDEDIARMTHALQSSETRYQELFNTAPVALLEENFSKVKLYIDSLRRGGVTDFKAYFTLHPEELGRCASLVHVSEVNHAALVLFDAPSSEALIGSLDSIFDPESYAAFCDGLVQLTEGKSFYECDAPNCTLSGQIRHCQIRWALPDISDDTWSRILVSCIDMTARRKAEDELEKHRHHLEKLVFDRTEDIRSTITLMAGREMRMVELKEYIAVLRAQLQDAGLTPAADDLQKFDSPDIT